MKFLLSAKDAKTFEQEGLLIVYKNWTLRLGDRLIRAGFSNSTVVPCLLYCYSLHTKYPALLKHAEIVEKKGRGKQMKLVFKRDNTEDLIKELLEDD